MSELLDFGSRLARGFTDAAIAGVAAFAPAMGRGTRPMPIDPSVQRDVTMRPAPASAQEHVCVEPRLDPKAA